MRILILLDGLNQNFQFTKWADWLQPLFEDDLGGMYRVIVSCWPNWWHEPLVELANLIPGPLEITVEGFNDAELDALLQAMRVERSTLEAVLPLMRVPRLSSLVAKHRNELGDSGDVTAERVIYEDWKDRLEHRGAEIGLTNEAMQSFVAELGEKLKLDVDNATVTRREVIESLSKESGRSDIELTPPITELSSGAWLKPGDKPHTFRVAADRIPFVLALTCSGLRTSVVVLENIPDLGSDYLRTNQPLGSHYLRMSADYLRPAHLVENDAGCLSGAA